MIALLKDMGIKLDEPLELKLDASAGIGIAQRRGAGRIRHIATPTLWLQKAVYDGKVKVSKVAGKENPADLGTKYLGRKDIERIWEQCGFYLVSGSSKIALKAALQELQCTVAEASGIASFRCQGKTQTSVCAPSPWDWRGSQREAQQVHPHTTTPKRLELNVGRKSRSANSKRQSYLFHQAPSV